jgi:predicted nucleic acid-binding protein
MARIFPLEVVLVDTGVIYALADRKDSWHERAVAFVEGFVGKLLVPATVIPEAAYLLNNYLGQQAEAVFLQSLLDGELAVEQVTMFDLSRAGELLQQYGDANIGLVDASVLAVAERLKIRKILTTDRRHFGMVRLRHCPALELLP